ncbi:MAG: transposase family protein [bacterium]|nr:transposase family protein [bacterium]
MDDIYNRYSHLLTDLNQPWLSRENLASFATAIRNKGAALENCWGFIDGTVRPICRPTQNQRVVYNGHKRVHAIKFQSVVAPNGMIANLFGPIEGRRHDSRMLAMSGLLEQLEQHSFGPDGQALCLYGDPAYAHRIHL